MITLIMTESTDFLKNDTIKNTVITNKNMPESFLSLFGQKNYDCFICNKKTADKISDILTKKTVFVLSSHTHSDKKNLIYVRSLKILQKHMNDMKLNNAALLGGFEITRYFLKHGAVDAVYRPKPEKTRDTVLFADLSLRLKKVKSHKKTNSDLKILKHIRSAEHPHD